LRKKSFIKVPAHRSIRASERSVALGPRKVGFATLFSVLLLSPAAMAQAIPAPALPGRIEQQFQPPPSAPQVSPPASVPAAPAAPAPRSGPEFVLRDVVVEGATVYTPAQLREEYAKYIGQTISVSAIAEIEEAITRRYRSDGYILTRAVVPAGQAIDPASGTVKVVVLEGYIDKVRLDPLDYEVGERGRLVRGTLKKIERACRPGDAPVGNMPCPLHRDVLERYLLLANDLPGVKASAVIQPSSDASAAADLFVTISEKSYDGAATLDNRGSPFIGPVLGQVSGGLNNMTGLYERTTVRGIVSVPFNELWLVNANEEVPLNEEGLRLAFGGTHSRSRPGDSLRSQNIVTNSDTLNAILSYPLVRTRSENLLVRSGFTWRNSLSDFQDLRTFDDRTRTLSVGATYDLADRWLGVNLVDVNASQGLPMLGATRTDSPLASHAGANGTFTKFNGELSRLQQIIPEWNILTSVTGQVANQRLLVSEQFGYGGERFGRAYDPSEIIGDNGIAGKAELQYTPSWAPGMLGTGDVLRNLQFYAFYDIGQVWNLGIGEVDSSAASAGAGLRFGITDYLSGYVEAAQPLTRRVQSLTAKGQDGKPTRVFFSLSSRF
jgi:hemolysin activation/secretion protein